MGADQLDIERAVAFAEDNLADLDDFVNAWRDPIDPVRARIVVDNLISATARAIVTAAKIEARISRA